MSKPKFRTLDNLSFQELNEDAEFIPLMSMEDEDAMEKENLPEILPILPLRNTVLFPGVVIPITAGRDKSIRLINETNKGNKIIGVVSKKNEQDEEPTPDDINKLGTGAPTLRVLKMPDGNTTVIIQGKQRSESSEIVQTTACIKATIREVEEARPASHNEECVAIVGNIKELALEI